MVEDHEVADELLMGSNVSTWQGPRRQLIGGYRSFKICTECGRTLHRRSPSMWVNK